MQVWAPSGRKCCFSSPATAPWPGLIGTTEVVRLREDECQHVRRSRPNPVDTSSSYSLSQLRAYLMKWRSDNADGGVGGETKHEQTARALKIKRCNHCRGSDSGPVWGLGGERTCAPTGIAVGARLVAHHARDRLATHCATSLGAGWRSRRCDLEDRGANERVRI